MAGTGVSDNPKDTVLPKGQHSLRDRLKTEERVSRSWNRECRLKEDHASGSVDDS